MTKWYSRLRFLDIKYGSILEGYFVKYGEEYDPKSSRSPLEMQT